MINSVNIVIQLMVLIYVHTVGELVQNGALDIYLQQENVHVLI